MILKTDRLIKSVFLFVFNSYISFSQSVDSISFKIYSRQSFYSYEKKGEILLHIPSKYEYSVLNISLRLNGEVISEWKGTPGKNILQIPFEIDDSYRSGIIESFITGISGKFYCKGELLILKYKPNEVKTDRLTGGLIVNNLPFFPFGFYTYSPVHHSLPEEEVVKGFNLISPYQNLIPETINQRKAYMDRCAQLGMKVNYNLASIAGGGGVNSKINNLSDKEKRQILVNEIKTFMNHPALLSWYIADEPDGNRIEPAVLEEIYRVVKETDPWHPVTIVFMTPFTKAINYVDAMDIVMADPYPVPVYQVTMAGNAAHLLKKEFEGRMPVWIVPQAFGGGEHWLREPTIQEIRSMTWQAIIEGATGIQYFIRQGLNAFPKSTATWNECGRMAMEVNSIVPWLLSGEESIQVASGSSNISVTSRMYRGQLLVLIVNKTNNPRHVYLKIHRNITGWARVLFENRTILVNDGVVTDIIGTYGSQVYKIDINPPKEIVIPYRKNLIADPGFEDLSSPGIPSACYALPGTDRGATYFTDPRVVFEGNYSLRMITPSEKSGTTLKFFPVKVIPGNSYMISIWAKADTVQRFIPGKEFNVNYRNQPQYVEVGMNDFCRTRFIPENDWKNFVTFVTIPQDTVPEIKANVILRMSGQGVAWFDMLQVIEDPLLTKLKN
ncbi:MAG: hypothetical protein ACUVTX_00120 [Bacteroidales bacterium]